MNLNKLSDDVFIDFAMFIDELGVTKKNVKVLRGDKDVKLVVSPLKKEPLEDYHAVEKFFRFKQNLCVYEYGCIRLDFTLDWQKYVDNLTQEKSDLSP